MKTEKEIEKFIDSIKIPSDDEVEAAGIRFDRRICQIRRRRWIAGGISSAAAVLLCGIVFALVWGKEEDRKVVEVAKVAEIDRRVTVPTLVLSDGISLNLKKQETNSRLVGSNIQIAENHITYDTVSKAQEIKYNTLIIPEGFTYDLTLADGTHVTLNAGSRLKYPEEFVGDLREVELDGEAYFNVNKSKKPFEVNVSGSKIRVYGTQFNVKTLRQKKVVETVLVEGKIGFKSPGKEEIQVTPGEQVSYDTESGNVEVNPVDVQYATAWLDGVFKCRDKQLNLVLEDISTWYGVQFEPQIDVTVIEVTMNLSKKTPIDEVILFLERMTNCKIIKERGYYVVK